MANSENLTPWKPGHSGNPKGRPKGSRNRSTIMRELLELTAVENVKDYQKAIMGDDFQPDTIADQIAAAIVMKALDGDVAAFKELMDSAFGKLTDRVENQHSFTQMGRVEVGGAELTFDVGSDPIKN